MTVGIAFTNGLEAIAITDSRSSGLGRQSDSVDKMGNFSSDKYSGIIFGTGSGNLIEGVIRNLNSFSADSLDKFVEAVHNSYKGRVDVHDASYLKSMAVEIEKKAQLIGNKEEKKQFIRHRTSELMQEYDGSKKNNMTYFILAGYDKDKEKIRLFSIDQFRCVEVCTNHMEAGSGIDGANLYLGTKLQGVDTTQLTLADLTFFALNAFSTSTVNQGVGGTPKIAMISKDGCEIIPAEKTVVLANLSGAYLSEFPASVLDHESARKRFHEVLTAASPGYGMMAQELGLNEDTLKTTYIPYSSWQERANRMLFNNQKTVQK